MAMNGLEGLAHTLQTGSGEIHLDADLAAQARRSVARMLDFTAAQKRPASAPGALVPGIGAA